METKQITLMSGKEVIVTLYDEPGGMSGLRQTRMSPRRR